MQLEIIDRHGIRTWLITILSEMQKEFLNFLSMRRGILDYRVRGGRSISWDLLMAESHQSDIFCGTKIPTTVVEDEKGGRDQIVLGQNRQSRESSIMP